MANQKNSNLVRLTECSVMLALSIALSFTVIIKMPMGGRVSILSMLPVSLISVKYGIKTGLPTAFLLSLFHLVQSIISGDVFVYCETFGVVLFVALFDYILPFTALGLAGLAKTIKKNSIPVTLACIAVCMFIRFACHFITGCTIWGQWAEDGMSPYIYSMLYNGGYMLPEAVLTTVGAGALLAVPQVRKLIGFDVKKQEEIPEEDNTYNE